jgi:hypothetical protein
MNILIIENEKPAADKLKILTSAFGFSGTGTLGPRGGVIGVVSKSTDTAIRLYYGRTHYNEWQFVYTGAGSGRGGGRGRGQGQRPGQLLQGPRGRTLGQQTPQ